MKRLIMVVMMVIMMASTAYGAEFLETENAYVTICGNGEFANIKAKDNPDDQLIVSFEKNGKIAGMVWEHDAYDGEWFVGIERIRFDNGRIKRDFIEYPYYLFFDKDR